MKVIVTGATGTAGRGIVQACLADDRITKIIILTRRAVARDVESSPKTEVVMHHDFSQYPDELMARLEGADACLWAIGGRVNQFDNDKALCRRVGVEYTLSGAEAMRARLAATRTSRGQPFRFVFCSGRHAEWDGKKPLLFLADSRRYKGEVERGLCALADDDAAAAGSFEVLIARPSGLVAPDANAAKKVFSPLYHGLRTAQLGRAMVRMAVEGWKDRIVENEVLMKM